MSNENVQEHIEIIGNDNESVKIDGNIIAPAAKFIYTANDDSNVKAGVYGLMATVPEIITMRVSGNDGKMLNWHQHADPEKDCLSKRLGIQYKDVKTFRESNEWVEQVHVWINSHEDDEVKKVAQAKADKLLLGFSKAHGVERGENSSKLHADNSKCPVCNMMDEIRDNIQLQNTATQQIRADEAKKAADEARMAQLESDSSKLSTAEAALEDAKTKAMEMIANPKVSKAELLEAMAIIAQ